MTLLTLRNTGFRTSTRLQTSQTLHVKRLDCVAHFAHLVEVLQFVLVQTRILVVAFHSGEQAEWGLIHRLIPVMTQEIVDLLIVGDILLRENRLDLVEVPIRYEWHLVYFFWHPSHMSVQTVGAIYAKSKSIVVALASSHSVRI